MKYNRMILIIFPIKMKYLTLLFLSFSILGQGQTSEFFSPNSFVDKDRIEKIKSTFPLVEKMYNDHAVKNHFPGYSFGIVVDGQLVFKGSGGFSNLENKTWMIRLKNTFQVLKTKN